MGYTHYWTQAKNFSEEEWSVIKADIAKIVTTAEEGGIALAGNCGDDWTRPEFDSEQIGFNGVGEDAHETFLINREIDGNGWDFCKTANKPYDTVVTACLSYLGSLCDFKVTSDGEPEDWKDGVNLARYALPLLAGRIAHPLEEE